MTGVGCGAASAYRGNWNIPPHAVTFSVTHLDNGVMRVESAAICPLGDAVTDGELQGRESLCYPLSCAQDDAIREALRLVGMGEALSSVSVFDGFCRAVAPGVVLYTVWLTG